MKDTAEGVAELLVPLDSTLSDYALRISEIVGMLEDVERRSQIDIVGDLENTQPN